ncbi:murein peptide amidase A [bacterium]|nr:murein peptide amidase A [bacterium]
MNILQTATTKLGNKIELIGEASENNILVIGVFHGDEPQGKYLIERYLEQFSPSPFPLVSEELGRGANNLLLIPCLNPDGMQNNTRTNANGVDLNRNFPTKNWGEDTSAAGDNPQDYYGGKSAGSEIETQFVIDIIEKYQPKLILTLHAPYKIVNYDGPAQDIAQKISDIIGYPVEPCIGYPTPGSFGTYCGVERNIPTITLELDEKIPVETLEQPVFEIFDMLQN